MPWRREHPLLTGHTRRVLQHTTVQQLLTQQTRFPAGNTTVHKYY